MQALSILRSLVRAIAATALGLLLAHLLFHGWNWMTNAATPSRVAAFIERPAEGELPQPSPATAGEAEQNEAPAEIVLVSASAESQSHDSEPEESATGESHGDGPSRPGPALPSHTETIGRLISIADEAFDNGSHTECVLRYQFLLPNTQGDARRLIAVKLGIAAENLSDLDLAARAYSASLETYADDELASFARVRIGVIRAAQGDFVGARSHLTDWLLGGGISSDSRHGQQAVHLLAEVQARIACGSTAADNTIGLASLRDERPEWPIRYDPPAMTLEGLENVTPRADTSTTASSRIDVIDQLSMTAEGTFITMEVTGRPLATVCEAVVRKAGISPSWSETGYRRAEDRSVTLSRSNLSLAVLLDLLTRGAGLVWLETVDGIVIASESELGAADLQLIDAAVAKRLLLHAISTYPDNDRVQLTTMSLANLDFRQGRYAEASQRYRELIATRASRLWVTEASINLGKAHLLMNDLVHAADAFISASDSAFGHPLQPVALLYAGRLYASLNRVDDAVPLFARAWTLSRGSELEPEALLCVCAAYAYLGNPMVATRLLAENGHLVNNAEHYHDQAAFIGCHCRYSVAQTVDRKLRDGRELLAALTNVDPTTFFSVEGWALVVKSYHNLGLDQEARSTLEQCLVSCDDCPFRNELFRRETGGGSARGTAAHWDASQFADVAALLGDEKLSRMEHIRSLLRAGDHAAVQVEAAELLTQQLPEPMQEELFDLLGRSYQRHGDHYLAALCFARINPFSDRALQLKNAFFANLEIESEGTEP